MSQLAALFIIACGLLACGALAMLRRRSLLGVAVGFELSLGGLIVLAVGLLGHTGFNSSLALVAGAAFAVLGAAAAMLVAAVHVATARAARSERGLEPW